jgi:hypothetical protein
MVESKQVGALAGLALSASSMLFMLLEASFLAIALTLTYKSYRRASS